MRLLRQNRPTKIGNLFKLHRECREASPQRSPSTSVKEELANIRGSCQMKAEACDFTSHFQNDNRLHGMQLANKAEDKVRKIYDHELDTAES